KALKSAHNSPPLDGWPEDFAYPSSFRLRFQSQKAQRNDTDATPLQSYSNPYDQSRRTQATSLDNDGDPNRSLVYAHRLFRPMLRLLVAWGTSRPIACALCHYASGLFSHEHASIARYPSLRSPQPDRYFARYHVK